MIPTLKDFDYELPRELVAPYPKPRRADAKLLVVSRKTGKFEHRIFRDIVEYLEPGDLLVLNNTKVLPARLFARKPTGGKAEVLLLKRREEDVWEILVKPSGRIKKGMVLSFSENGVRLEGEILDDPDGETGVRRIRFLNVGARSPRPDAKGGETPPLQTVLNQIGRIPLPPYIDRPTEEIDRERYQTVFADIEGAVASPTAGLHFDEELLGILQKKGVEICFVTLHTSYGTFQPVQSEDLSKHEMYEEEFEITEEAGSQIQRALKEKRRIAACGTTVVRVLETMVHPLTPTLSPGGREGRVRGKTRLFIYPPYEFKLVDVMITNFHLPKSTLLMLVSAFAGHDLIFRAYEEAIRSRYRFYSYGDAMLVV